MKTRPNIFDYATSELSQDAFLCWLIAWADSEYKELDEDIWKLSQRFLSELINVPIKNIEVGRQLENIDVWVKVNDSHFIIIEDKKGTTEHSDQLERYAQVKAKNPAGKDLEKVLIYFKMEEQSDLSNIDAAKYKFVERHQMLLILGSYFSTVPKEKQNHILADYYENLVRLESAINSYKTLLPENWHYYSWMGFFSELQKSGNFNSAGWGYVSNPSGGFMGFWWNFLSPPEGLPTLYLQAQKGLLSFRMASTSKEENSRYKAIYQKVLHEKATDNNIELVRYGSAGKSMGIYKLAQDFLITNSEGILDYDKTVELLIKVSLLVTETFQKLSTLNLNNPKNGN
jgi:hypothetical protein